MTESLNENNFFVKIANNIIYFLQSIYISCSTPFVKLSNKMSEKVKNRIIIFLSFLMLVQIYLRHTKISLYWIDMLHVPGFVKYTLPDAIVCLMMVLFGIASIKGDLKRVKCNPVMVLLWTGMCFFMLISAVFVSKDWATYSIIFIIVFPAVFFVWQNRRDYTTMLSLFIKGVIIFNVIFIVGSMLLRPVTWQQYCGLFNNPNSLGQYLTLTIPIFLIFYEIGIKKKKISSIIWSLIGLGTSVGFLVFSASRTAFVSLIAIAVVWLGFKIYFAKKQGLKVVLLSVAALALVCVAFVPITWTMIRYGTVATYSIIPRSSDVSLDSSMKDILSKVDKRVSTQDKDLNSISTHRTLIYQEFLKRIGIMGHSRGEIYVSRYGWANTAHDNIIQMAYDNGTLAAIIYAAFNLISLWLTFKYYLKMRLKNDFAILPLLFSIGFLITSLVTSVFHPFNYGISFVYWMLQIPLFDKYLGEGETV